MKLILANNQTEKFVKFYDELKQQSQIEFDYSGYTDLLFILDSLAPSPIRVLNVGTGKSLDEYDGVYINGYLNSYELAAAVAICCDSLGVPYQNKEMQDPPSLSKLSMYAKLVAKGVTLPKSVVGSKKAMLQSVAHMESVGFPAVLKRADADRGIDNYKVRNTEEIVSLLDSHEGQSVWVLQQYIENTGYYLVTFYNGEPTFSIYRTLEVRPDGNEQKSHMYKPKGGVNASLVPLEEVESSIIAECTKAAKAMNRQIASVDCIYDKSSGRTYILEVNYNPQFVTIETFKEQRVRAFLDNLGKLK